MADQQQSTQHTESLRESMHSISSPKTKQTPAEKSGLSSVRTDPQALWFSVANSFENGAIAGFLVYLATNAKTLLSQQNKIPLSDCLPATGKGALFGAVAASCLFTWSGGRRPYALSEEESLRSQQIRVRDSVTVGAIAGAAIAARRGYTGFKMVGLAGHGGVLASIIGLDLQPVRSHHDEKPTRP